MTTVEDETRTALDVARSLALAGVPIFLANPDPAGKGHNGTGYWLPGGWQQTAPEPAVLDAWRPGMAVCALMGCGVDLADIDPRNGGTLEALTEALGGRPGVLAEAATPSGGTHLFIPSLGAGSHDGVLPGIDVKGGLPDGSSRGFAFLAPTVRVSKVTGERAAYRWAHPPDVARIGQPDDSPTWDQLAALVRAAYADSSRVRPVGGPAWFRDFMTSREPQSQAAAERAINEKLTEVREWTAVSGTNFRTTLLRAAMTLGGYVGGGYLLEGDAWTRLEAACTDVWGQPDEEDRRWIEQGLTDGEARPFPVYTPEDEALYGESAQRIAATRTNPPRSVHRALGPEPHDLPRPYNDQELGEVFLARASLAYRYAADSGTWLINDGRPNWTERGDLTENVIAMVARLMPLGDPDLPNKKQDYTADNWRAYNRAVAMSSAGSGRIARKMKALVAGGDHPASLDIADLDANPEILWAGGWPWDLRASREVPTLAAIDPGTPHLHTAACMPDATVLTPYWDRFVGTVWPDAAVRAWALRVLSISLAGYADAALPVLYGPERTGKTSLVVLLVKLLGTYGHAADPRLLAGADRAHASIIYVLKGRRLSFIDEGPRRGELATAHLKALTGGGPLTGNAMRANPVTFEPTHTLVMTTNDEPPITDPALRARMRIVPCEADQDAVRAARQAITAAVWEIEAPGVLAAMMRECAAWLAEPASALPDAAPAGLRGLVDDMAATQNPVHEWVEMCTVPTNPGTGTVELYERFCGWYSGQARFGRTAAPSLTSWGRTLTDMGYPASLGGPRGKTKIRPLSVMNGPIAPPLGPAPVAPAMPTVADGLPTVADGSAGQLSATDRSRSGTSFAGVADSADSSGGPMATNSQTLLQTSYIRENSGENRGSAAELSATVGKTGLPPAATPGAEGCAETVGKPSAGGLLPRKPGESGACSANTASDQAKQPPAPAGAPKAVSPRSVTASDAAARAHADGVTKAEARKRIADERRAAERLAKITDAAGEYLGLPAVADRAGNALPVTLEQAEAVVRSALARSGALTVDVEHSGYPIGHEHYRLKTVQLGDEVAAAVFDPIEHAETIRALLEAAPRLIAFSATADLVPIAHAGLAEAESMWERMFDVVIPAKLADPRSTGASADGLKATSAAVLRGESVAPAADAARDALFSAGRWLKSPDVETPVERSGWAQVDSGCATMVRYAASDVLDTAALARRLPPIPAALLERERLAQRMTARVAHDGVRIDADRVRDLTAVHTEARAEWTARVQAFGIDNPGSSKQVAEALDALGAPLPRSAKTGAPSAAAGAIEPLRTAEGPVGTLADAVLQWRHHDTVLGTFLGPYRQLCEHGDGRARPTVYTLGTDTGRMSCVRPNLQQLPREGGVRACITADPGQLMIGADFSGVEIRVAAALSQDATLLALLAEGRDLHAEVARIVFGEGATKAHRYTAKRIVFGRLYGGGIPTLAAQGGCSIETAQRAVDTLDSLTPQLTAWSASIREAVKRGHTQFPSYSGRIIHLPREYPHKGPNYCIQGSARELLIDALVQWRDTKWGSATLLPVHDELDVFVPEADAVEATNTLVACMRSELYGVAIVAEPSEPAFAWADSS